MILLVCLKTDIWEKIQSKKKRRKTHALLENNQPARMSSQRKNTDRITLTNNIIKCSINEIELIL